MERARPAANMMRYTMSNCSARIDVLRQPRNMQQGDEWQSDRFQQRNHEENRLLRNRQQ